mgnify:FL=1
MKNICTLQFQKAVDAIKHTKTVMYKHGVWNEYYMRKTEDVIKSIQDSGYGADVRYDENSDRYFVSVPCDADMW